MGFSEGPKLSIVACPIAGSKVLLTFGAAVYLFAAAAIGLNELRSKFMSSFVHTVLLLPHFLSWVIISYLVYSLLHPTQGFINGIIENFETLKAELLERGQRLFEIKRVCFGLGGRGVGLLLGHGDGHGDGGEGVTIPAPRPRNQSARALEVGPAVDTRHCQD